MGKKRERTDPEKVFANWNKTLGLLERDEYSVAIVRAAVTVEIAANIVIRAELVKNRKLPADFVDSLLKWSNGLAGKFDKLIYPILKGTPKFQSFQLLAADWKKINEERNNVAHRGDFKTKSVANDIVSRARKVLQAMMTGYQPTLKFGKTRSEHRKHRRAKSGAKVKT
jgi:hypothetical protein